ncbi:cytochrome P450 [Phytomonospora sp. NPDC050363]|uniref:cytochrome P450 family protein n=1 Tax=Phytomonospora sp. NPDC050363 TaxID=3155642 RepID=UPI0033D59AF4
MTPPPVPVPLDSTGGILDQIDTLRGEPPQKVTVFSGVTAWVITKGADLKALATDRRVSRDPKHWPGLPANAAQSALAPWVSPSMLNADGADHKRLRKIIGSVFGPRRIEEMRPAITRIVDALLDKLAASGPDEVFDLRSEFSFQIPIAVICDLVGVPDDQRAEMAAIIEAVVDTSLDPVAAGANSQRMWAAFQALIDYKRDRRGDDMITGLLAYHDEHGDQLSADELAATLLLLVGAGSETAVSLINHLIVALMANPEQLQAVLADPTRWGALVEETLRKDPPVGLLPLRYAVEDIQVGGVVIPKGDPIIFAFAGHGRDPGVHADPDTWNPDRDTMDHTAFGHGIHFCIGAPLARLEAQIAASAFFERFPGASLACPPEDLTKRASFITNEFEILPVLLGHSPTPR